MRLSLHVRSGVCSWARGTAQHLQPVKTQDKPNPLAKPTSPRSKHALPATTKPHAGKDHGPATVSTKKAVEAYAKAVEHENSGQLNEALHLYRKAFKLDDRVEKAYNTAVVKEEERSQAVVEDSQVVDPTIPVTAAPPPLEPYVFRTHTQLAPDYHSPARTPIRTHADGEGVHTEWNDPLTRIINKFEEDLYTIDFVAEEEKWPVLLATLPDEVIENVIFFLDVQSLERFALTCKKARLLTRTAPVWRYVQMDHGVERF
jgi:F-box protein 9